VELVADLDTRLARNRTEHRLAEKKSKRDVDWSDGNVRELELHVLNTDGRSRTPAQDLHVDVRRDSADWPLLGFILMVDEFRPDNGATRFVPGSHRWPNAPTDSISDLRAEHAGQVLACGRAGSLLIFNGSAWHGHAANTSRDPRRSIQGAFIPRDGRAGTDFAAGMQPETRARLGPLARQVLAL